MIVQLWNTNTPAFVSHDADLTENYMYISMKFGTGVHVFCWEVGVFNRSSFQSVSYNMFRHMHVPRDTSVLCEIIIVCLESVGNCQLLEKDRPLQLVKNIIFRPFSFLFFASDDPRFIPLFALLRGAPTMCFVHCFHVYQ